MSHRTARRLRAAGLLLAVLAARPGIAAPVAAAARDEPSRLFGDWLAACDNGLDCVGYGFGTGDTQATLILSRPRGAAPTMVLVLQPDRTLRPPVLRLQPARHGPAVTVRMQAADDGMMRGSLTAGEVTALLPFLRNGGRLLLTLPAPGGRAVPFGVIGLAGAGPAMDWIDERQRHPAVSLPVPVRVAAAGGPPPDTHHVPPAVGALPAVQACRRQDADDPATDTAAWRLSRTVSLWQVPCGSGNFDRAALYVLADPAGTRASLAGFTSLPQMAARPAGILVNAEVAADGTGIIAVEPSRGLGDCGDVRSYRWDGTRFRLILARLMTACHGLAVQDWPIVYRAGP